MSLRHALLGLLNVKPASGYDLLAAFGTTLANVWPATQSQVYRELGKLCEEGLLEVGEEGARGRKGYSITPDGRRELVHWLVDVEPGRVHRDETLLRVFFLGNLSLEQAVGYLRQEGDVIRRRQDVLELIERSTDWEADDIAVHGRLTLEYGRRLMAMRLEWTDWAVEQLNSRRASTTSASDAPASTD